MDHFTPISALAGGCLIGLAAVLMMWLDGRIAGVSGIAGGLWFSAVGDRGWRVLFIVGLMLGSLAWCVATGQAPTGRAQFPAGLLVLAGVLVGYGTSMGGGCTSGHGVCGIARWAPRSLLATGVFLTVGIATTYVVRHVWHLGA